MPTKKTRRVTVELRRDSWSVVYCDRKVRGRYWAASFFADDHTREDVIKWVRNNPKLEFIEST